MQKAVFITGTSKGLGCALVERFLAQGWRVYCLVRTAADAAKMSALDGDGCVPIVSDVTSDNVAADIAAVLPPAIKFDVLINNAGYERAGYLFDDVSTDAMREMFDVHCLGAMRVTRALLPFMRQEGILINVSSRFGLPAKITSGELDEIVCSYSYKVAKAAQNMFTACLSREYKNSGLKICALHPGRLKTDSGSADADREPGEAAARLFALLGAIENGGFYNLFEGKMSW